VAHGLAHLLAQQYALGRLASMPNFAQFYPADVGDRKVVSIKAPMGEEFQQLVAEFLAAYPVGGQALKVDGPSAKACAEILAAIRLRPPLGPEPLFERERPKEVAEGHGGQAVQKYLEVARRCLDALRAPLTPALKEAVARIAVDKACGLRTPPEIDEVVAENGWWYWDDLARAEPVGHRRQFPNGERYVLWHEAVWDDTAQFHARGTATELHRQLREETLGSWFWYRSAKEIRVWYKALLPSAPPTRRKLDMMFALTRSGGFPQPVIVDAFREWHELTEREARRYEAASEMPPRPLHLEHLIRLVTRRIQAFDVLTGSDSGPQAFGAWERRITEAVRAGKLVPLTDVDREIEACFREPVRASIVCAGDCIKAAKRYTRSAHAILGNESKLRELMQHWRPDRFIVENACGCGGRRGIIPTERALPPSNLSCRCHGFSWQTPAQRREDDFREDRLEREILRWAIAALVGEPTEVPWTTISVRARYPFTDVNVGERVSGT
jgi:hypothetical protein